MHSFVGKKVDVRPTHESAKALTLRKPLHQASLGNKQAFGPSKPPYQAGLHRSKPAHHASPSTKI